MTTKNKPASSRRAGSGAGRAGAGRAEGVDRARAGRALGSGAGRAGAGRAEGVDGARAGRAAGTGPMDPQLIERIVLLMRDNDLNMVEVRDGQQRIVLRRGAVEYVAGPSSTPAMPAAVPARASSPESSSAGAADDAGLVPIKSPMVGTFYSKPSPDAKPFVSVGSVIDDETDVCIIEAMKTFNTVKAECRGMIAKVLAIDGAPVDFNKVLFLVKPS